MKEFLNCLRIQIRPNHFEDERIDSIVKFCKKYDVKNVMLFINAVGYFVGHMTIEEAKPWVKTMKKAKKILNENGISVSLNQWIEMGHSDRFRSLKEGQNFQTMVDHEGTQLRVVACPLDPEWRKYFLEFYTYLIKELEPEVAWIEDDFRLFSHGAKTSEGGCWCPHHIRTFNEKYGTNYTREELVKEFLSGEDGQEIRKKWLLKSREDMLGLITEIANAVKALGLNTKMGLMTGGPGGGCVEARDWLGFDKALRIGDEVHYRVGLPYYTETYGKQLMFEFNAGPMANREFIAKDGLIFPELENASFSTYAKEGEYLGFHLESSIPLCLSGMTYDIFDFLGNGCIDEYGYGEAIKSRMNYLNGVVNLGIDFDNLTGVILPIDEFSYVNIKDVNSFADLATEEFRFGSYLSMFGNSCRFSKKKQFKNEIVALTAGSIKNFTDEQLEQVFKDNFIFLDGNGAEAIYKRGLTHLLPVESTQLVRAETSLLAYEEKIEPLHGIKGRRASTNMRAGNFMKISYSEPVKEYTRAYDTFDNFFGCGIIQYKNVLVFPWVYTKTRIGVAVDLFNPVRSYTINEVLRSQGKELVQSDHLGVCCYRYKEEKQDKVIVVNSTIHPLEKLSLYFANIPVKQIFAIDKESGKLVKVNFTREGDKVTMDYSLSHLSTATFVVEKE